MNLADTAPETAVAPAAPSPRLQRWSHYLGDLQAYAAVKAPIAGRIGRALVTEGALVGQGDATQLALIQQTGTLYVNFTQSAGEVIALRRALESGQFKRAGGQAASVRVLLDEARHQRRHVAAPEAGRRRDTQVAARFHAARADAGFGVGEVC